MKLQYVSDLHVHHRYRPPEIVAQEIVKAGASIEASALAILGDVGSCNSAAFYQFFMCLVWNTTKIHNYPDGIYFVPGNHEYDNVVFNDFYIRRLEALGITVLCNEFHVSPEGLSIFGGTGWYPETPETTKLFNDFHDGFSIVNANLIEIANSHNEFVQLLESNSAHIVLTHHVPVSWAGHPKFVDDPYNVFFYTDLDDIIDKLDVRAILWGHTHHKVNIYSEKVNTFFGSNPLGYSYETTGFKYDEFIRITKDEVSPV